MSYVSTKGKFLTEGPIEMTLCKVYSWLILVNFVQICNVLNFCFVLSCVQRNFLYFKSKKLMFLKLSFALVPIAQAKERVKNFIWRCCRIKFSPTTKRVSNGNLVYFSRDLDKFSCLKIKILNCMWYFCVPFPFMISWHSKSRIIGGLYNCRFRSNPSWTIYTHRSSWVVVPSIIKWAPLWLPNRRTI